MTYLMRFYLCGLDEQTMCYLSGIDITESLPFNVFSLHDTWRGVRAYRDIAELVAAIEVEMDSEAGGRATMLWALQTEHEGAYDIVPVGCKIVGVETRRYNAGWLQEKRVYEELPDGGGIRLAKTDLLLDPTVVTVYFKAPESYRAFIERVCR
ncbi:hypothetical protein HYU15_01605 [Candidatus Woesearchaeota archaeon]|nr:hypothetical protein [Candidatus Woesearchaeota archaeon]